MAAPKRTQGQREEDLVKIADWYLKGRTQTWMGKQLGVDRKQIAYDLETLNARWQAAQVDKVNAAKVRELQRIDLLEQTYWQAWRRSLKERKKTKAASTTGTGKRGGGKRTSTELNKEDSLGDPRYLAGIQWCVEQRCKIIGLLAPTENRLGGVPGAPVEHSFTNAEMNKAMSELQAWNKQQAIQAGSGLNSLSAPPALATS